MSKSGEFTAVAVTPTQAEAVRLRDAGGSGGGRAALLVDNVDEVDGVDRMDDVDRAPTRQSEALTDTDSHGLLRTCGCPGPDEAAQNVGFGRKRHGADRTNRSQ